MGTIKIRLANTHKKKILALGQAFDIGQLPSVFDGGRVAFVETIEEKESEDGHQGAGGSESGSRQGTEAGPWRAPGEASRDGRVDLEAVYLSGLAELKEAYPTTVCRVERGLWAIVASKPLGNDGPEFHFVIAVPFTPNTTPRAWAFWDIKRARHIGPRHTNFPDASICAFGPSDGAWEPSEGLRALADLYSTWVVRQLFFALTERWPGRQHGSSALYRLKESHPGDWCGCDSGARYKSCHQPKDMVLSTVALAEEHRRKFGGDYCERLPPQSVISFVLSRWEKVPPLEFAYANI